MYARTVYLRESRIEFFDSLREVSVQSLKKDLRVSGVLGFKYVELLHTAKLGRVVGSLEPSEDTWSLFGLFWWM